MAFVAGNILVLAVEFEPCSIVIERRGFPTLCSMTGYTFGNTSFFKLPVMLILMTGVTVYRQSGKFLN
jgi:hypothetical protein